MPMAPLALLLSLLATALAGDVLLNAGGPPIPSIGWRADTAAYASAASAAFAGGPVKAPGTWAPVYNTHRWATAGNLEFKIPVPAGAFGVALLFAETWTASGAGVRQMVVKINGAPVAQAGPAGLLDVFAKAGGVNLPVYVNAGSKQSVGGFITVTLERVAGKNNPMISGIAIKGAAADQLVGNEGLGGGADPGPQTGGPGTPPTVTPVATAPPPAATAPPPAPVTPPTSVGTCPEATTTTGRVSANRFVMNVGGPAVPSISWGADNTNYIVEASKGTKVTSSVPVPVSGSWGAPYLTYRWTSAPSLTYKIPAPAGTYQVSLLHAESYVTAPGQRTFGISINGDVKEAKYDVFALAKGQHKPVYKTYSGIKSVGGFITIAFTKGVENPFVNGIYINGPGAGTLAIGGPEDGSCTAGGGPGNPKSPGGPSGPAAPSGPSGPAAPIASPKPDEKILVEHYSHGVSGGPYVAPDLDKDGKVTIELDGSGSHSHATVGNSLATIVQYLWTWNDPTNPSSNSDGVVTANTKKVTAVFPLGKKGVTLFVKDSAGFNDTTTTTVTVVDASLPGAYCYHYNLGKANPATVNLPVDPNTNPKPNKAANVGDINFGNTAAFDVPFGANAFYTRCVYLIDLPNAATLSYKLVHTGPVKIYHNGVLQASSNSNGASTVTNVPAKAFSAGPQNWQIHYLRKPSTQGKLILQGANGAVLPAGVVRHDSSTTLPVITGLNQGSTSGDGGEIVGIFGSAFVNQVEVFFGSTEVQTSVVTAGNIQVIAPPGTGTVQITVKTAAGTSNAVPMKYVVSPPVKFVEDFVRNANGAKTTVQAVSIAIYGPDRRLYLGGHVGEKLTALTLNKKFVVTKKCETGVGGVHSPRAVLGLAFNPKSNALKLHFSTSTVYWKDRNIIANFGQGWTNGKVETVTMAGPNGCFNNDRKDLITGLPVSNHDHGINSLQFLPSGELLIAVGGFTNGGISVPGDKLGGVASNPLEGAIISCPASGTAMKYSNLNDPVNSQITGGACKTWATGLRNTFAMEYATNNHMYATDNGANQGFGRFSTNCVGGSKAEATIKDRLFKIQPGKWHGYASIHRKECVHRSPSAVQPILQGMPPSTNGIVEYRSNTFDGKLKGDLFLSQFAFANNGRTSRVKLDPKGDIENNGVTNVFFGKGGLTITEGPGGEMVLTRPVQNEVLVLKPDYPAPTTTTLISALPRRGPATGGTRVLLTGHNFGGTPSATLNGEACTNVQSIDESSFTCTTPAGSPNSQVTIEVTGSKGISISPGTDFWYF